MLFSDGFAGWFVESYGALGRFSNVNEKLNKFCKICPTALGELGTTHCPETAIMRSSPSAGRDPA